MAKCADSIVRVHRYRELRDKRCAVIVRRDASIAADLISKLEAARASARSSSPRRVVSAYGGRTRLA
jgi:hypothetical protein